MLQYDFIQRALLAGVAISFITPILGLLLILRRQSLLSDTLSHISLAGVAFGLLLQWNPTLSTLLVVIIASLGIEYLRVVYPDFSEVSVAMMMAAGTAIALILANMSSNASNFRIEQYLFGSILLISKEEVILMSALAVIVVILYIIFRKPLYALSFDEATAQTSGLPTRLISIVFSVLTGIAISIMMPIVGSLLVSALIVIPSATSIRFSKSFTQAIVYAWLINIVGIFAGISLSYYGNTPPGASITICFLTIFAVLMLISTIVSYIRKSKNK